MTSTIIDDVSKVYEGDINSYVSLPYMTKYEFDQLIGMRTTNLSRGAPIMVEVPADYKISTNMELRVIAIKELVEKRLPYIIKRTLPNGKYEYWPVSKLGLEMVRYLLNND